MEIYPIIPFEPIRTEAIPQGEDWIAQVKWDGVRIITYFDGNAVRLFNRQLNERTGQFPELTEMETICNAKSVIFDGEVIAFEKGKPSFQQVMKRDGIRRLEKVNSVRPSVPISYMVFDILYYNGKWVNSQPLKERQEILKDTLISNNIVHPVENFPNANSLFEAVKGQDLEGIVCKRLSSTYAIGGKDNRWQKVKNYRDILAVVGGVTLRDGIVNALLLGAYDPERKLWYVGHAGTGKLKGEDWVELTRKIQPLVRHSRPFVNRPAREKEALWLEPEYTVKVRFMEWTSGGTLRQPSIQAFVQVKPTDCLLE
jgi:bifunctional non-homologous end joining protein LigD